MQCDNKLAQNKAAKREVVLSQCVSQWCNSLRSFSDADWYWYMQTLAMIDAGQPLYLAKVQQLDQALDSVLLILLCCFNSLRAGFRFRLDFCSLSGYTQSDICNFVGS